MNQQEYIDYIKSDEARLSAYTAKSDSDRLAMFSKYVTDDTNNKEMSPKEERIKSIREDVSYRKNPAIALNEEMTRPFSIEGAIEGMKPGGGIKQAASITGGALALPGQLVRGGVSNAALSIMQKENIPEIRNAFIDGILGEKPARFADVSEAAIGGPRWLNETIGFAGEMAVAEFASGRKIVSAIRNLGNIAKTNFVRLASGAARDDALIKASEIGTKAARELGESTIGMTDDFVSKINKPLVTQETIKTVKSKLLDSAGKPISKVARERGAISIDNLGLSPVESEEVVRVLGKKTIDTLDDAHKIRRAVNDLTPDSAFVKMEKKINPDISLKAERLARAKDAVEDIMKKAMNDDEWVAYKKVNKIVSDNIKKSQKLMDAFGDSKKVIKMLTDKNSPEARKLVKTLAQADKGVKLAWESAKKIVMQDKMNKTMTGILGTAGAVAGYKMLKGKNPLELESYQSGIEKGGY